MASRGKDIYPLEALLALRERRVEATTTALAGAIAQRESASCERERAEDVARGAEVEVERLKAREREALSAGNLTALDLIRGGAWQIAVDVERQALAHAVEQAAVREREAVAAEHHTRATLSEHKAEADVIGKDRSRHLEQARRRIEAKEEELSVEAWRKR